MMFSGLGVCAFYTYNIINLRWIEEDLYIQFELKSEWVVG